MGQRRPAAATRADRRRLLARFLGAHRRVGPDDCLQLVRLQSRSIGIHQLGCRLRSGGAMMLDLFHAIEFSAAGQLIKSSSWAFAVTESIHLLALSVIGGAVLVVDLRMLGLGL